MLSSLGASRRATVSWSVPPSESWLTTGETGPPDATRSSKRRALLYGLTSVALWSTVATGFKLRLRELTPVQLLLLGCLAGLVLIVAGLVLARWPDRESG